MWYPATVTAEPQNEPVSLGVAKAHLRVAHDDDDTYIGGLISTARGHAEKYCGMTWAAVETTANCDDWCDLDRLPMAPATEIVLIEYVDALGAPAILSDTIYEFRADARSVVLRAGKNWPAKQTGSRIALTALVGPANVPPAVKHAILLRIEDFYEHRGSEDDSKWTAFDSLLSNHRHY